MEISMNAFELGFFSIPVLDIQKGKSFYSNVMGWEFKDRDPQFTYIFANEKMIGSLELSTGHISSSENGPLMFFRADFMEKTLARVTDKGGTVREKIAIENGARGYTAKIVDPFKNTIAFWAPEN
jgi:predicted enzyme related to lactoylglutathione lyase